MNIYEIVDYLISVSMSDLITRRVSVIRFGLLHLWDYARHETAKEFVKMIVKRPSDKLLMNFIEVFNLENLIKHINQ